MSSSNQPAEFDDIFVANQAFANSFEHSHLTGTATRGLAIVTCMDSRISPLAVVGMQAGEMRVLKRIGKSLIGSEDVVKLGWLIAAWHAHHLSIENCLWAR